MRPGYHHVPAHRVKVGDLIRFTAPHLDPPTAVRPPRRTTRTVVSRVKSIDDSGGFLRFHTDSGVFLERSPTEQVAVQK